MTRILSTKKLKPNQKQFLLNAGHAVVEADFISIKNIEPDLSIVKENLIFTSGNAVKSILENESSESLKSKACVCVGIKTKALLQKNGFHVVDIANSAAELAKEIIKNHSETSFTFFSGNIRRDELPQMLGQNNIDFDEITVYETALEPIKINIPVVGILFFSPSAVESYLRENVLTDEFCFCIGETTAAALPSPANIVIANQPTIENTIIQCINHYKTILAT